MDDKYRIDNEFTYWVCSCPDPTCEGYDYDLDYASHGCPTCGGRDIHPIPMSELYSLERLFYLYERAKSKDL